MTDNKEYKLPEEMNDKWLEYMAAIKCRDKCIQSIFKAGRAISYGKTAEKARLKFWRMVYDLYPNLEKEEISYSYSDGNVVIVPKEIKDNE